MVQDVRYETCKEHYAVFTLLSLFWMLSQQLALTKSCAYFSFENSTVRTNSVEVTEHKTVILVFYLKYSTCMNTENISITIRRLDLTTKRYTPQCDIVLKNGMCRNTTYEHMYCGCLNTFGEYTFSKIVSKSDITWWKWTTKDGLADDVYIFFNESHTDRHFESDSTIDDKAVSFSSERHTVTFCITTDVSSKGLIVTIPVTTDVSSKGHIVTIPVTTDVSSKGHTADVWMFAALPLGLIIIIVIIIVIIIRLKKAGTPLTYCFAGECHAKTKSPRSRPYGVDVLRLVGIHNRTGDEEEARRDILPDGNYLQQQQPGHVICFQILQNRIVNHSLSADDEYIEPPNDDIQLI